MAKVMWVAPDDGSTLGELVKEFPCQALNALIRRAGSKAKGGLKLIKGECTSNDLSRIESDLFRNRILKYKE